MFQSPKPLREQDCYSAHSYGWYSANPPHTHDYLAPGVVGWCQRLGARRVLDLGCGNGAMSQCLVDAGFAVVGCDVDAEAVGIAARQVPQAIFKPMGVYDDPSLLGEDNFDVVISTEVIEHLFYPRALPRFARAVLRRGGHLIVSTPYHGYLKNVLLSLGGRWDRHHSPWWDGGHIKFWSRASLTRLLMEEQYNVVAFAGVGRLPYLWKSMLLLGQCSEETAAAQLSRRSK